MTVLAVIRHGATAWTEARRLQGRSEIGLSATGRTAVDGWRLPEALAGFAWFSSPLRRCRDTAAGLRRHMPAPDRPPGFEVDPRLTEMSFGAWEGRSLAELRAALGPEMAAREALGLDFRAPGGESPREVQARLAPWLAERAAAGVDTFAVTHRGVIRALYALATGWPMTGTPPVRLRDPALHLFSLTPEGSPSVQQLNRPLTTAS